MVKLFDALLVGPAHRKAANAPNTVATINFDDHHTARATLNYVFIADHLLVFLFALAWRAFIIHRALAVKASKETAAASHDAAVNAMVRQ